ncbi:MAG: zf-HC2 domain-containing protein [Phycisphaerales bacterium]|nr:zf-HC2 domain-containing protein [Phycisphaerales bacterium]
MEHLSESDIIRFVAGELDPVRSAAVRAHLSACAACGNRCRAQNELWATLGAWQPPVPVATSTCPVERALRIRPSLISMHPTAAWRAAAALLIGIGLGHGTAWWLAPSRHSVIEQEPAQDAKAMAEEAALAIGVEVYERPTAAGLYTTLLNLHAAGDESVVAEEHS